MTQRPLIVGLLKARNEIVREANLHRCIANLRRFCDDIVACDDASSDGTRQVLQHELPADHLLCVPSEEHDFRAELAWKQRMMTELVDPLQPHWVWWADADEELEPDAFEWIRETCEREKRTPDLHGYRFQYLQLWRNRDWYRTDDGFNDGRFVKLWRWNPRMKFSAQYGTHHQQFPTDIKMECVRDAPHRVVHWGNYGKNLVWKAIQYHGGLGGVERHISFEDGTFERMPAAALGLPDQLDPLVSLSARRLDTGEELAPELNRLQPWVPPKPKPFTKGEKKRILDLRGLRQEPGMFTVVIPTRNRAWALPQTLESLLNQTYQRWIALVLDDGSTDETPDLMRHWQETDPRIFYARYPAMGAVAMNEIGMDCASSWTSWWTRLGSDDYFEPHKLELDALALTTGARLVYGPYRVLRGATLGETCNTPRNDIKELLTTGRFYLSWANIAAASSLLIDVKKHYGGYCDPRLVRMEDFHANSRLVRFADPVFRARYGQMTVLAPSPSDLEGLRTPMMHDAIWRTSPDGASSDVVTTGNEDELTREIILAETAAWVEPVLHDDDEPEEP